MQQLKNSCFHFLTLLLLFSCNHAHKIPTATETRMVAGSTGNKLEVLDFGGTGEPMLFLTGLGNSAHVFTDFAPKFADKFHVYALSRRGYGASEQTPGGYRIDTLAMDILAVLKALNLQKVILVGHSIAGDEMSKFASSYPDKVSKVVYLDAAYDRSSFMSTVMPYFPAFPMLTKQDSASFENVKTFAQKNMGVTMPDAELEHTTLFGKDGRYEKDVTPGEIQGKIMMGIERPNYAGISCPALAIYSMADSVSTMFAFYNSLDAENKKKADTCFSIFNKIGLEQIALFKKEVKHGTVKEIKGAHHYVFLSHPVETEKYIRDFLE